jgi:hypothetical protein
MAFRKASGVLILPGPRDSIQTRYWEEGKWEGVPRGGGTTRSVPALVTVVAKDRVHESVDRHILALAPDRNEEKRDMVGWCRSEYKLKPTSLLSSSSESLVKEFGDH